MQKSRTLSGTFLFTLILIFLVVIKEAGAQQVVKSSTAIPDNINKILTNSCAPCHTSNGGLMSKAKLNLTNWTQYSLEKQKDKANAIYSMLEQRKMPPKSVREKKPDLIPSKEQVALIKKWVNSLKTDNNK
jgi:hypothetical protein